MGLLLITSTAALGITHRASPKMMGGITTSVQSHLDVDYPQAAIGLEPWGSVNLASSQVRLRSILEQPMERHHPFRIPLVEVLATLNQDRELWGLFFQTTAVDLEQWSLQGWQLRQALGPFCRLRFGDFSLEISGGAFLAINEFRQHRNGTPFPAAGLLQQLGAQYEHRGIRLDFLFLAVQQLRSSWTHTFSTQERIALRVHPQLLVGILHQYVQQQPDATSGAFVPLGFFDARKSKVAGFLQWQL